MYEVIKHYLKKILPKSWFLPNREVLEQEYEVIFDKVKSAKTLAQLANVRKDINEYRKVVREIGSPKWATTKSNILAANWQRQYRLWKARG